MRQGYSFSLPVRKYGHVHLRPTASVEFSAAIYLASKGGLATITVNKTGAAAAAVNYSTQPGSAQPNVDYLPTTGMLSWGSGEAGAKTFNVTILDSADQTGSVALTLVLTGSDLLLGDQRTATLQINRALVQTLIVPDDLAFLSPVPNAGLLAPQGGLFALEGADGGVVVVDLAPGARFSRMVPRRVLKTGTGAGFPLFGLSRFGDTSLSDDAGDRVLFVTPSDVDPLPLPAVGGIYAPGGGSVSLATSDGVEFVTLAPASGYGSAPIQRISATGTDAQPIYAFVRDAVSGDFFLVFSDSGGSMTFSEAGQRLLFIGADPPSGDGFISFSEFGSSLTFSEFGSTLRFTT